MKKILDKIIVLMMVVLTSTTLLCANVVKAETEVSNNLNDFVSSAEIKDANGNTIGGAIRLPIYMLAKHINSKLILQK